MPGFGDGCARVRRQHKVAAPGPGHNHADESQQPTGPSSSQQPVLGKAFAEAPRCQGVSRDAHGVTGDNGAHGRARVTFYAVPALAVSSRSCWFGLPDVWLTPALAVPDGSPQCQPASGGTCFGGCWRFILCPSTNIDVIISTTSAGCTGVAVRSHQGAEEPSRNHLGAKEPLRKHEGATQELRNHQGATQEPKNH